MAAFCVIHLLIIYRHFLPQTQDLVLYSTCNYTLNHATQSHAAAFITYMLIQPLHTCSSAACTRGEGAWLLGGHVQQVQALQVRSWAQIILTQTHGFMGMRVCVHQQRERL